MVLNEIKQADNAHIYIYIYIIHTHTLLEASEHRLNTAEVM